MKPAIRQIVTLFERWGWHRYDEQITQLEHGLQAAALATAGGGEAELVVAALLHDVGHLLQLDAAKGAFDLGVNDRHEGLGSRFLGSAFGSGVTRPIALHVEAKRYLCAFETSYHDRLSEGSKASLVLQGGPMGAAEIAEFERRPGSPAAVALRRWDEEAKRIDFEVPALSEYLAVLDRVAA